MDVQEGDLVVLKSGGAMLTVTGTYGDRVEVAWSDGRHAYQSTYPRAVLLKVELSELQPAAAAGEMPDLTH
jgi:uncharacterized protein YodC (DUF2158 family)